MDTRGTENMEQINVDCLIVEGCNRYQEEGPYACLNCNLNFGALPSEFEKQLKLDLYLETKRVNPRPA
jgi:hypothetical protein